MLVGRPGDAVGVKGDDVVTGESNGKSPRLPVHTRCLADDSWGFPIVSGEARPGRLHSALAFIRAAVVPILAAIWTALGSVWTYYTWYYQEIIIAKAAPVNLTTKVSLEKAGEIGPTNI